MDVVDGWRKTEKKRESEKYNQFVSPLEVRVFSSPLLFSLAISAHLNVKLESGGLNRRDFEISLQGSLVASKHGLSTKSQYCLQRDFLAASAVE